MNHKNDLTLTNHHTVLAIDPTCRGFGYAVLEGPQSLVDWGLTTNRTAASGRMLHCFKKLLVQYRPDVVVLKLLEKDGSKKSASVTNLTKDFARQSHVEIIPVKHYSIEQVYELFTRIGGRNKEEIADALVEWFPQIEAYRPPRRKTGNSEDERINIFDAIALALTFYYYEEK